MTVLESYEKLKGKVTVRKKDFDDFINFLENETIWLTAPASIRYHNSFEGGLLDHSVRVCENLLEIKALWAPEISDESCVITGLFHDVGKIGSPKNPRYLKNNAGYYTYNKDQIEMSIAHRSLYLVSKYINLTEEEAQAILYHDGQYIDDNKVIAHKENRLTLLITFADTWAAAQEGKRK